MAPILNAQGLSKTFGATPLFSNVSFVISEGDRIGLIGPNGSGKSTLLQILAGSISPDGGEVALRKRARLSYVVQDSRFAPGETARSVVGKALERAQVPEGERANRLAETLGRAGFDDFEVEAASLSGGWQKRLAIAEALVQQPDILLLDEPTNHLDLGGIKWLEGLLQSAPFACVVVSHDRYFLENIASEMAELNRAYPDGVLRMHGNYSSFLESKEAFLHAQAKHQEALENRVRTEIEWLRRGPKARATKAKARIDKAHELIGELADLNARTRTATTKIDFSATDRKTKRLVELEGLSYELNIPALANTAGPAPANTAGPAPANTATPAPANTGLERGTPCDTEQGIRRLFENLDFIITAGMRVGLVGPNGSGKTTLLRLIEGSLKPSAGEIRRAESLRVVHFDQRRQLDPDMTLARALAPDSDSVVYQDRVIHVASWAARFMFSGEQLNQPVGRLSGGERARVLVASLMLQPADVLLLDEPTNDLDIPTLEVLEESLLEYRGAMVLVTHDRYMLDRVSTVVLGLDGQGGVERFADYSQWEAWQTEQLQASRAKAKPAAAQVRPTAQPSRKKLSYLEAREYAAIEQRIAEAEQLLQEKRNAAEDPAIMSDGPRLLAAHSELEEAQKAVDELYARWAELEEKQQ